MTHTEDDLRAALRLLEQRVPAAQQAALGDVSHSGFPSQSVRTRRGGGRRHAWTGPLLAAAAVVAVAVTAITIGVSSRGSSPDRNVHPQRATAPPAASPTIPTRTAPPAAIPLELPGQLVLDPTWLPAAGKLVTASVGYGSQLRGYDIRVDGFDLYALLSLSEATSLPTGNKRGRPLDLRLAGRPAREWAVDHWYTLAVQINSRQVLTVDLEDANETGVKATASNLTTMGRHIARALRLDGREALQPYYVLTWLPAGTLIANVDRTVGEGTTYQLTPVRDVRDPGLTPATITEFLGDAPSTSSASDGQPVQGHQTLVRTLAGGGYGLTVLDLRPGISVDLQTGRGVTGLADLYRIANGIRWHG